MVGDGHAMGVAAEIVQHIFGAAEGTFQVNHPVFSKQWPEPSSKDLGFGEELQLFGEAELTILEGLPEGRDELATKDLTQYRFGQEVVVRRADPAGVIERETSCGHHTMDMGMKPDLLVPGVQHTEETNLSTEVSGIASDFEKGFRAGTKQEIVDHLFVLQHDRGQVAGECEDHVQVARGEQFSSTCGNPPFASSGLTLWAMAITAAVIRDGGTMCAAGALIEMPAERGRATPCNRQQHFDMFPTDPLAVSLDEGSSSSADEIGNLERRRGHWSTSSPIVTTHLYQNRLAITAPLAHAQRPPPGGYVQTPIPSM